MQRLFGRIHGLALLLSVATLACSAPQRDKATVRGTVLTAEGRPAPGLNAALAGTAAASSTDAGGAFSLDAPARSISALRLTGPGIDGSIGLPALHSGLLVTVPVRLEAGGARLDGEIQASVRGAMGALQGSAFDLGECRILTDSRTQILAGARAIQVADLKSGEVIDVLGVLGDDGCIRARSIHAGARDDKNRTEVKGLIAAILPPDSLIVSGTTVHTTSSTQIEVNDQEAAFSSLAVGQQAEIKGTLQADKSILASRIESEGVLPAPAPIANAGADQSVASGALVTLDGTASTDPAGLPLSYSWTQSSGPAVTLSGASTATPTFAAPSIAPGLPAAVLGFTLVVSDSNGSSAPSSVSITVNPLPQPPIASAGPDQTVDSGAFVTLDGSGSSDPAGLPLSYSWSQAAGPVVALSDAAAVSPAFTAPAVASGQPPAVLVFSLIVSDANSSSAPATVRITVNPQPPPNLPPLANAGPDQSVASEAAVTLDGRASFDPEAEPLTFSWTQASGPAVALSGANTAQPTFTAPAVASGSPAATLVFSLVVTDPGASSTPASVTITVNPAATAFPPPPGTPPPAPSGTVLVPNGGSGSNRFQVGAANGLYLQDPAAGEPSVLGFVVVTLSQISNGSFDPPPDTVVTLNGVALLRDPNLNGSFFRLDPAGPQPVVGTGGQMVIVASGTVSGKLVQRQLVLPCPSDIEVTSTPPIGSVITGLPSVHLASPSDITLNVGVPAMASIFPQAQLFGYDRATRTLAPSGTAVLIAPGPLGVTVPVTPTAADAYLMDLRWPGTWIIDGETGGFCGLAKRWTYAK